jgi:hypothetical protein
MRGGFNLRSHDGHGQSFLSTETARCSTLRRASFAEQQRYEASDESGRATNPPSTCDDGNCERWTWATRVSASVEYVRSDPPQRLALALH